MLLRIAKKIQVAGGESFLVGGCVRDSLLGIKPKDFDVEVFGLDLETLMSILSEFGEVDQVGRSFGILKLGDFDFSLPRRDSKIGEGHKGFQVKTDKNMTPQEACLRRDLTINGMSQDILTGEIIDTVGGMSDLENGVLREINPQFAEDPLRVLRVMQFSARYGFVAAPSLVDLSWEIKDSSLSLPKERIWGEWEKLLLKGQTPSFGLEFLKECGWLPPELKALVSCPQDAEWHPEGDVWKHTCLVLDEAARLSIGMNEDDRILVMLGAICHDLGKPDTTTSHNGRIVSPGHADHIAPTLSFLDRIGCPGSLIDKVAALVREHMVHLNEPNKRSVRRLIHRLPVSINLLGIVIEADHSGRHPLPKGMPESMIKILDIAQGIGDVIEPIVKGRHLLELGFKPGPEMGKVLKNLFEKQLDGEFETLEDGLKLVETNHFNLKY